MYYSSGVHFISPEASIKKLRLEPGMKVADFGAGSWAYVFALAKAVLGGGQVYAIDVQKELLDRVKKEGRKTGLSNIEIIWGDIERAGGTKLADQSIDAVVLSNVLFQLNHTYSASLEAKRGLKPGGKVLVIDWTESFGNMGPVAEQVVTPAKAREVFASAGFEFKEEFPAGPHHYGLIFIKPRS